MGSSLATFLHLSARNLRYFVQWKEGQETRVLTWQHVNGCHFTSEVPSLNNTNPICSEIFSVLLQSCAVCDQFLRKNLNILEMGEDIPK